MLGDCGVVINWANGAREVEGHEHADVVRGVVVQFVRWYMGGVFRPKTDEADWCRPIFREHNTVADMHANSLMDNGIPKARHVVLSFDGARRGSGLGAAAWVLWVRDEAGSFEKVSRSGRVLRDSSAMVAEREALRMGI